MMFLLIAILVAADPECAPREPLPVPTQVTVVAWDDADQQEKPVVLKGKQVDALSRILRSASSYDTSVQARCFEPRHKLTFAYGTSTLDAYALCFQCHNLKVEGSNPFVGCSRDGTTPMPAKMSLKDDAYAQIRKILIGARVKHIPALERD